MNILSKYKTDIEAGKIIVDLHQEKVLKLLEDLSNDITIKSRKRSFFSFNFFGSFSDKKKIGLYIWGDVGRGKTYLVDTFYNMLSIEEKARFHFYHFMSLVHEKLKLFKGSKDPLKKVAKYFNDKYILICLDEFFVSDIADAMILYKIFNYFFYYKIIFIITSNIEPIGLYKNGLQRNKFLPAIDLFYNNLNIVNIGGNIDYRNRSLKKANVYLHPISIFNFKLMRSYFFELSTCKPFKKDSIEINNRKIFYYYLSTSIIWFDFKEICGDCRSHLDYIELAHIFNTVFISGMKSFYFFNDDITKRFISFIDEFYDKKKKIFILSDKQINLINVSDNLSFDFKRTISRINEMSSVDYVMNYEKN